MFKVDDRNTRTRCEIYTKLTERHQNEKTIETEQGVKYVQS